jgi:hypothetical protein
MERVLDFVEFLWEIDATHLRIEEILSFALCSQQSLSNSLCTINC